MVWSSEMRSATAAVTHKLHSTKEPMILKLAAVDLWITDPAGE